ncbi:MAG: aldehyde ferredoxin oxidoreductase C-terminal domain-containing protein, partial [Planctomycetota bacterium]|nr:aldehyde ferredoxin oxidoreductase C-terminal domain-containing protein [Planctomycetota bacterium]
MDGFFQRLLRIDLNAQTFCYEHLPEEILRQTLGGKGLGTHLLLKENPVAVEPLSPENRFFLTVGPATGTKFWSQSRFGAFSKSPATGGFMESYCGGTLAPKIKGCGIDAVIIEGRCRRLSFLIIDENGVRFSDATALAGKDAFEADEALLAQSPEGAGAMVIGPAGENLVAFACIKSDLWRSLGRGGMGAVMGSKNLKGLAFAGTKKASIARPDLLKQLVKDIAVKAKASPATRAYQKYGTPMQVQVVNGVKCFPTRYWQKGYFEKWENLSAEYMQNNFDVKACGCPNCFLRCTKLSRIRHGRHAGLELEGPEFETIYALGGLNELDSLEEVAYLNVLCDRLGLDTISAGNISAFAVEAYRRGKLDFPIDYNQPDRMAELFRQVASGQGPAAMLGRGIKQASEELGLEDIAIHVKGLEPAGFDPRVLKGMGLSYATSPRGACHLRGTFYKAELSGQIDPGRID